MKSDLLRLVPILCLAAAGASAQSTLGVILGTVKDASGGVVRSASVRLTNEGENTSRETLTGENGDFAFYNVKRGVYGLRVTAPGFREFTTAGVPLEARNTVRIDATLAVGEVTQTVEVSAAAGVIATDSPIINSTLTLERVASLPVNVRAGGSTSPYNIIATLPGVQPDNGNGFGIQGGIPAQSVIPRLTGFRSRTPRATALCARCFPRSRASPKSRFRASAIRRSTAPPATSRRFPGRARTTTTERCSGITRTRRLTPALLVRRGFRPRSAIPSEAPSGVRFYCPASTAERTARSFFSPGRPSASRANPRCRTPCRPSA